MGAARVWERGRTYWLLLPITLVAVALLLLDLLGVQSAFWDGNPLVVNFVSEALVATAIIYGVDRVLKARSSELWRPLGVMIVEDLNVLGYVPEHVQACALEYCWRTYGEIEVPEGRWYPDDILLEALEDPETWAGSEDLPHLLTYVREQRAILEERFVRWAPVLIAESSLATIAGCVSELLDASKHLLYALEQLEPERRAHSAPLWDDKALLASILYGSLEELSEASEQLEWLVSTYVERAS